MTSHKDKQMYMHMIPMNIGLFTHRNSEIMGHHFSFQFGMAGYNNYNIVFTAIVGCFDQAGFDITNKLL